MRDEWVEATLDTIADVNPEATNGWSAGRRIRYIDLSAASCDGGIDLHALSECEYGVAPGRARRVVRSGDVLVATVRPYLRGFAMVDDDLDGEVASTGFTVLRARTDRALPGFIWSVVRSEQFVDYLMQRATGSSYPAVRPADVAGFPVQLPPLDEQRRIVDLIGAMDSQLSCLRFQRSALVQSAVSLRHRAFSNLVAPDGRASELFDMLLGRQKSERQSVGEHVIPYIRAANISDGALRLNDVQSMNFSPGEQHKYGLRADDILVVEGGTVGLAARWGGELAGPVGFDKHVIRLRAIPGTSTSEFALQWAKWCRDTGAFEAQATGITIKALGFGRACAMPVPRIPVSDQESICAPLAALDEVTRQVDTVTQRLSEFRSRVLTDLLYGSTVIPETYDDLLADAQ